MMNRTVLFMRFLNFPGPVSVVRTLVKYSKQAFYSGIPKYYNSPPPREHFIMDCGQKNRPITAIFSKVCG